MSSVFINLYNNIPLYFISAFLIVFLLVNKNTSLREKVCLTSVIALVIGLTLVDITEDSINAYYAQFMGVANELEKGILDVGDEFGCEIVNYAVLYNLVTAFGYLFRDGVVVFFWLLFKNERVKKPEFLLFIPIGLLAVLCILNPAVKLIAYHDEYRFMFHHGVIYDYNYFVGIFYGVLVLIDVYKKLRAKKFRDLIFIGSVLAVYLVTLLIESEMIDYDGTVVVSNIVIVISCLFYYLFIHSNTLEENITKKDDEISYKENQLKVSQINPHFIFNTLNSIVALSEPDSEAQNALITFSKYLRVNIDSINTDKCIPFESELEHVKSYVSLEKLRFGSRLSVDYKVRCTSFTLPSLSVQPLVENSIKYGMKRNGKAKVIISTEELGNSYLICVTDNSGGFDRDKMPDDGRKHVGLENVEYRLKTMRKASMEIKSVIGEGSKVVITIPKEEK